MSENDDLSRLLEQLADQAPPAPAARQMRARLQAQRGKRYAAVGVLSLAAGMALMLVVRSAAYPHLFDPAHAQHPEMVAHAAHPPQAAHGVDHAVSDSRRVPLLTKATPLPAPLAAIDPAMGSQAVVDAIVACLQPSADADFLLWKDHGIIAMTGTGRMSRDRLAALGQLLGRVTALDLRFIPGFPPHLSFLIANHHA